MSQRLRELVEEGWSEEDALRIVTTVDCSVEPSRTKQSQADEADINKILERFERTGFLPVANALGGPQARFGDFSDGLDYVEAQNRVAAARQAFEALPARVRERFRNDPAELVEFLGDSNNLDEAVKLGLVEVRPKAEEGAPPGPGGAPPGPGGVTPEA